MVKRNFLLTGIITLLFLFPTHAVEFSVENNGNSYDFDIGGYGGILPVPRNFELLFPEDYYSPFYSGLILLCCRAG